MRRPYRRVRATARGAVYPREVVSASPEATRQAYRAASWVMGAVAFAAAVMTFAVGLAAITEPNEPPVGRGDRLTTESAPPTSVIDVLAADQSNVTGTLTKGVGMKVDAPPLVLPLTLTVSRGGGTKADFSGGTVAGKKATISWDGGRPLPIRGQGSIDFNGPVDVELGPRGASWLLDGGARVLTPGSYAFGSTVAVSSLNDDLGAPRDGARLDVPAGAAASVQTRSGVRVSTPAAPISLKGPGQLVLEGAMEVTTRDGVRQASKITFGPGAFELNLVPQAGGYRIERAFLQGPTTLDG